MTEWLWVGFIAFILVMLALDLGVFHRDARAVSTGEALAWTGVWIALALAFNVALYFAYNERWFGLSGLTGQQAALQFLTGYLIEKSLSLDNIFIIAVIFGYFRVPLEHQHRVLFWGVLGALVMRAAMVAAGTVLITRFFWMSYVFGGLLLVTAVKMLIARHDNLEPDRSIAVRIVRRIYPVTPDFEGGRFFTRIDGRRAVTPLFVVLVLVESTDVLFAVDSVPAIFAVTSDPFIVFTSNIFAILGLRSLYFALAAMLSRFRYLKTSLVFLLAFVGVKMALVHHVPIPTVVSLAVILGILGVGVAASIVGARQDTARLESPLAGELSALATLTLKRARRIVVLVIGSTTVVLGVVMVALPGPGLAVIIAGIALLATEFIWARRLLARAREQTKKLSQGAGRAIDKLRRGGGEPGGET